MIIGPAISICSVHSGPGADAFDPSQLSGLALWLRADLGITLGGTLLPSGPSPPAVTITGTLTQPLGIWVDMKLGGARGAATFDVSTNNGSTIIASDVLTAATYEIPGTGVTLNFPVGIYDENNLYQATVSALADQSGNGRHAGQATPADQPIMIANFKGGRPALSYLAANSQTMVNTGGAVVPASSPWSIFLVASKVLDPDSSAHNDRFFTFVGGVTGSVQMINPGARFLATSSGGTNITLTSGTFGVGTNPFHATWMDDGNTGSAAMRFRVLGVEKSTSGGANLLSGNTGYKLGDFGAAHPNCSIADLAVVPRVFTASEITDLEAYAVRRYGDF